MNLNIKMLILSTAFTFFSPLGMNESNGSDPLAAEDSKPKRPTVIIPDADNSFLTSRSPEEKEKNRVEKKRVTGILDWLYDDEQEEKPKGDQKGK